MLVDQLPLKLGLKEPAVFSKFLGSNNQLLLDYLKKNLLNTAVRSIYLWGQPAVGKTYLLHAACEFIQQAHKTFFYLDLHDVVQQSPVILENLEEYFLICLDGMDAIAGHPVWEEKIFHLYNRAVENKSIILFSAIHANQQVGIKMPDLLSRMNWGGVFQVQPLDDNDKKQVLALRAKELGLELSEPVLDYILRHYTRNLSKLCNLLYRLDEASISTQRKLTIPFIKVVLTD